MLIHGHRVSTLNSKRVVENSKLNDGVTKDDAKKTERFMLPMLLCVAP
jgi:hypothetical protein